MTKKVIRSADFSDAEELAGAIMSMLEDIGNPIAYIASNGFLHEGTLQLIEQTLSDGSKVYDMEIVQNEGEDGP